jgi:hypothetical protein
MSVTTQNSVEVAKMVSNPPTLVDPTVANGKLRFAYFAHTQDGAGDATSTVCIAKLPRGKVRLIPGLSCIQHNWTTASATVDIGWDGYTQPDGTVVAADPDGIDDGISVETAGVLSGEDLGAQLTATGRTKLFDSKNGVDIRLTSQDVALAAASTASGYLAYVVE